VNPVIRFPFGDAQLPVAIIDSRQGHEKFPKEVKKVKRQKVKDKSQAENHT
jgi:hypothetical protein